MKTLHSNVPPQIGSTNPFELAKWIQENWEGEVQIEGDKVQVTIGTETYLICRTRTNEQQVGVLEICVSNADAGEVFAKFKTAIIHQEGKPTLCRAIVDGKCVGHVRICFINP